MYENVCVCVWVLELVPKNEVKEILINLTVNGDQNIDFQSYVKSGLTFQTRIISHFFGTDNLVKCCCYTVY